MDVIYLITNKTKNKFYVGSKKDWKGEGSYWGSSKNKEFWEDFETDDFVFEILCEIKRDETNPKKLLEEEIKELKKRNVLKDPSYYNQHIPTVGFSSLGVKRPGVGGRKPGFIAWSKGKTGLWNHSEKSKKKCGDGSRNKFIETWKHDWDKLIELYESKPTLDGEGEVQRNGKILPYDRVFSKTFYKQFPVTTPEGLHRVIKNLDKHKELMESVQRK